MSVSNLGKDTALKIKVVEARPKRGNASRWQQVRENLLNLPDGKVLEVNLSSYDEAEKLKNAIYRYAMRNNFKVSIHYGVGTPTSALLYIQRLSR